MYLTEIVLLDRANGELMNRSGVDLHEQRAAHNVISLDSTSHQLHPDPRVFLYDLIFGSIALRGGIRVEFHIWIDELMQSAPTSFSVSENRGEASGSSEI